jgi:hypothetical protein
MSVGEKYGFTLQQALPDSAAVELYTKDHMLTFGYPLDTKPASDLWFGICKDDRVWGVFGVKKTGEKTIEFPDFYTHRSRWGILAAYAALEIIKGFADQTGMEVVTVTPTWNKRQLRAMERVFGVSGPTHLVYRYTPPKPEVAA